MTSLWESYQVGLVVGVVWLTTLHFYPGKPWNWDRMEFDGTTVAMEKEDAGSKTDSQQQTRRSRDLQTSSDQHVAASGQPVKHQRRVYEPREWTPYQTLNRGTYLVLVVLFVTMLSRVYQINVWGPLQDVFPKETGVITSMRSKWEVYWEAR